jgi:WD40-like Beta Propeller Repeat
MEHAMRRCLIIAAAVLGFPIAASAKTDQAAPGGPGGVVPVGGSAPGAVSGRGDEVAPAPDACIDTVVSGNNDLSHVMGGSIAFGLRDVSGQMQIFTAKPDGSDLRQLTSEGQNGLADWSPDGRQLAFMAIRADGNSIGVMNADGSNPQLFAAGGVAPDWSPDRTKILFSTGRSGLNELWVMDADGGNQMRLFPIDANPFPGRGAWQPVP